MRFIFSWIELGIFLLLFSVANSYFTYPEEKFDPKENRAFHYPTIMTFHETKTNSMLGETLLKRLYSRIDHTENLIRLEISQVYDKLKEEIQKNFRKCDRKRRRVENLTMRNTTNVHEDKHQKRDRKKKNNNNKNDKKPFNERDLYRNV